MKKFVSAFLLSLILIFSVALSASAESAVSNDTGFTNVSFSNGYYGFCIDRDLKGAY